MKTVLRVVGTLALLSVFSWAFLGLPWWSSVAGDPARGFVLLALHIAAIMAGVAAWIE